MVSLLLKRIWNMRRANGWVFAELFIVFIIFWYVIDFLFATLMAGHEPKGYDTDHVYHVSIEINPQIRSEYTNDDWADYFLQIVKITDKYPGVESTCYYGGTVPYVSSMFQAYTTDSINTYRADVKMVNKDFFEVFKVKIEGEDLTDWDIAAYPRPALISTDLADSLFKTRPYVSRPFFDFYSPDKKYITAGTVPETKIKEYERYKPFVYVPIEEWMLKYWTPYIAVRVQPDKENGFADRFATDMRDKLSIGPFYFSQIKSYNDERRRSDNEINNYIKSSVAILLFFTFNVFLGIMGTFWFRTRKRRGEIGLRMAIGASRKAVSLELVLESICILVVAAIPALIVCFNIWYADLTVNTLMDPTFIRFLAGISITFILMFIMIVAGVWYPSRQAMKIPPADALHEE